MASNQMHRKDNTTEEKEIRLPETGKVNIKVESAPGVNIKAASGQGEPGSVAKFEVVVNAEAGAAGQEQKSRRGTRLSQGQGTMLSPGGQGQQEQQSKQGGQGQHEQQSRQGTRLSQGQGTMLSPGGEGQKPGSYGAQSESQEKDKVGRGQQLGKNIGGELEKQDNHAKAKQDITNKTAQAKSINVGQHQQFSDKGKEAKDQQEQKHEVKQQNIHAKAKQDMNKSGQGKSQQDDQGQRLGQHEVRQQDLHAKAKQDMDNKTSSQENSSQQKKTAYNKPGVSVVFHEHGDDQGKDSARGGEQKPTMQDIMPSLIVAEDRFAKAKQSQPQKDTNKSAQQKHGDQGKDTTLGQQFGETKQTMQDIMPSLMVAEDRYAKAKQSQPQKDANKTTQEKQKPGVAEHDEQTKKSQEQRHRHGDQTKQEQHDVKQQNLHAKAKQSQPQKDTNKSTQEKQKLGVGEHDEQTKEFQERRNIVVSEHGQRAEKPQERRHGDQTKQEQHSVTQQNLHAKAKQSPPQKETNKSAQEWNRAVVSGHGDQTKLQQRQKFGAEAGNDKAKQSQTQHDTNKSSQEKSVQQKYTISKKTGVSDQAKKPQEQGPGATAKHGNQLKQSKGNQRGVVNERDDEEDRWEVLEPAIGEEAEIVTEGVMQAVGETIVDIAKTAKDFVIGQDQHGFPIAEVAKTEHRKEDEKEHNSSRIQVRGQYDQERGARGVQLGRQYDQERGARGVQLGGQYGQERVPEKEWGFQQGAKGFAGFSEGGWQDSSMEVLEPTIGQQAQDGGVLQAIGETLVDIAKTTKDFVIGQDQPGAEGVVIRDGAAKGFAPKDLEAREHYAKTNEDRWTVDGSAKGLAPKDSEVREQNAKTVEERWTVGG